ncbi:MAG: sodium-dependent transporter [Opitutales bacterium]|nr:sodium-dependent transporter [Opitutales bacterium]
MDQKVRVTFGTKLGIIAATAGSAVGLGNIWRFPSQTAQDGGAIFVFVYLACVAFFGMPIVLAEFILGRAGKANSAGTYRNLAPGKKFHYFGYFAIIAAFLIMGFYMVVSGWTMEYLALSITGELGRTQDFAALFDQLRNSPGTQIFWMVVFMISTAGIVAFGVKKGIELASKLMMPLLLLVMIILCIRAVTLPGAGEGLTYLFAPNPENARSAGARILTDALGQSFFSLSVGMGCLMTYASYFGKDVRLAKTAGTMATLDTSVALLSGVMIFPAAFALTTDPGSMVETLKTGGPGLVFIAIPQLLQSLPAAQLWSIFFFLLLVLASLTSTISLLEVITAFVHEEVRVTLPKPIRLRKSSTENTVLHQEYRIARPFAVTVISAGVIFLGVLCSYSLGADTSLVIFGLNFFDFLDYITAKLMMPIGGIFISLFAGWYLDKKILAAELSNAGTIPLRFFKTYRFILRFVAPVGIAVVLVCGLIG